MVSGGSVDVLPQLNNVGSPGTRKGSRRKNISFMSMKRCVGRKMSLDISTLPPSSLLPSFLPHLLTSFLPYFLSIEHSNNLQQILFWGGERNYSRYEEFKGTQDPQRH